MGKVVDRTYIRKCKRQYYWQSLFYTSGSPKAKAFNFYFIQESSGTIQ